MKVNHFHCVKKTNTDHLVYSSQARSMPEHGNQFQIDNSFRHCELKTKKHKDNGAPHG